MTVLLSGYSAVCLYYSLCRPCISHSFSVVSYTIVSILCTIYHIPWMLDLICLMYEMTILSKNNWVMIADRDLWRARMTQIIVGP